MPPFRAALIRTLARRWYYSQMARLESGKVCFKEQPVTLSTTGDLVNAEGPEKPGGRKLRKLLLAFFARGSLMMAAAVPAFADQPELVAPHRHFLSTPGGEHLVGPRRCGNPVTAMPKNWIPPPLEHRKPRGQLRRCRHDWRTTKRSFHRSCGTFRSELLRCQFWRDRSLNRLGKDRRTPTRNHRQRARTRLLGSSLRRAFIRVTWVAEGEEATISAATAPGWRVSERPAAHESMTQLC